MAASQESSGSEFVSLEGTDDSSSSDDYETADEDPEWWETKESSDESDVKVVRLQDYPFLPEEETSRFKRHVVWVRLDSKSFTSSEDPSRTEGEGCSSDAEYETVDEENDENDKNDENKENDEQMKPEVTPSSPFNSALEVKEFLKNHGQRLFKEPLAWYKMRTDSVDYWWYHQRTISEDENSEEKCEKTTEHPNPPGHDSDCTSTSDISDLEAEFNNCMQMGVTSTPKNEHKP